VLRISCLEPPGGKRIRVSFDIPNWLIWPFVLLVLLYRRVRYGYSFRRIPLTRGKYAMVDADDYERLNKYKWLAQQGQRTFYAMRRGRVGESGRGGMVWMHREIIKPANGMFVDHINHNGVDNRKSNLRAATRNQNMWNRRKGTTKTRSKYKGLSLHNRKKPWSVRIKVNGESKFLGFFENEVEAAKAYDRAARKFHGEFAALNFADEPPQ